MFDGRRILALGGSEKLWVTGLEVDFPRTTGAKLGSKEPGNAGKDAHIRQNPARFGEVCTIPGFGGLCGRQPCFGPRVKPSGHVQWGVAVALPVCQRLSGVLCRIGKELRIKGRRIAEPARLVEVIAVGQLAGRVDQRKIVVNFGPVIVIAGRGPIGLGHDVQHTANPGQGLGHIVSGVSAPGVEQAQKFRPFRRRVMQPAPPDAIENLVFLPVIFRYQRPIGIIETPAGLAAAHPPLVRQRLANLDAGGTGDCRQLAIAPGHVRIAPEQDALGARPDAERHRIITRSRQKIAIAVTQEPATAFAETHRAWHVAFGWAFLASDRRLMVGQAHVFGQILGRNVHRQSAADRGVDQFRFHALGMQINLDRPTGSGDALKHHRPEVIGRLRHPAFDVHPKRDTADLGNRHQQSMQRVAAIGGVVVGRDAVDGVIGPRRVIKIITLGPEAEVKFQPAPLCFTANELQRFKVVRAFVI